MQGTWHLPRRYGNDLPELRIAGTKPDIDSDARVAIELLMEGYKSRIVGTLSCYDRIIIQGWCYAQRDDRVFVSRFVATARFHGQDEMGNGFNTRNEGTRIQHTMGAVSIQLYDKFRLILGIETP